MDIWIFNIFRSFISLLDKMVYWFVELLVSLFDSLASIRLFNSSGGNGTATDFVQNLSDRIYIFLAIIMIFKVSFSIIQYIIDPDKFSNQEIGMGKMIQGILIVLVSLVGVRYVFSIAYDLQTRIMDNHIVEQIILGIDDKLTAENQIAIKRKIPFTILSAFVVPNYESNTFILFENGKYACKSDANGTVQQYDENNVYDEKFGICLGSYSKAESRSYTIKDSDGKTSVVSGNTGIIYNYAYQNNDYSMLLDLVNDATASGKGVTADVYIFDYKFIISTIAGVFVVIMYLNFCIDLAIRSVKFGFLQLIAPIPIISMIDPKSSKNGMMSKWVKNCINTYLGLFIRVAAVNFVVFIINIITDPTFFENSGADRNTFIQIIIILGALMFAKELPKMISDLTGIDMKGDFKLNPLSRIPIAGKLATKAVTGTAKAAGSLVGGAIGAAGQLGFTGASVLASSLGSLGQAAFGAARGQGWNFNSDRVAREWRLGRNRMGDAAIGGVNGALTNMGSIVGAKPKGIPNAEERNKSANKQYRDSERQLRLGRQLEEQVSRMRAEAMQRGEELSEEQINNALYQHEDFARDVTAVKSAKRDMINADNRYKELVARSNSGDMVATAQLASAGKALEDAKTTYNSRKEHLEKKAAQSKYYEDNRRYMARKAYTDMYGSSSSGDDNPVSEAYMADLLNSNERPSIGSNANNSTNTSTGTSMPTINPRQNNNNNNNSGGQP